MFLTELNNLFIFIILSEFFQMLLKTPSTFTFTALSCSLGEIMTLLWFEYRCIFWSHIYRKIKYCTPFSKVFLNSIHLYSYTFDFYISSLGGVLILLWKAAVKNPCQVGATYSGEVHLSQVDVAVASSLISLAKTLFWM